MKVLLITQDFFPIANATSNCVRILLDNLKGCEKTVAVINSPKGGTATVGDMRVEYIKGLSLKSCCINSIKTGRDFFEVSLAMLKVLPHFLVAAIKKTCPPQSVNVTTRYIRTIEAVSECIIKNNIDVIVTTCAPSETVLIGKKMKKRFPDIKWIPYYFDPFCTNYYNRKHREAFERAEYRALKYADRIIILDLIRDDYEKTSLKKYLPKMVTTEFPTVKEHIRSNALPRLEICKDKIRCLYMGNLYKNIRDPEYMLKLAEAAGDEYLLDIFGKWYDEENGKTVSSHNVKMHTPVSIDEAFDLMLDGDILINIGNSVVNQMPSKIMDYISTGKPVVNICKLKSCPTLAYTAKYPLALNLFEEDGITEETVAKFKTFCTENKGKQIPYDTVKEIYKDCTAEFVSKSFAAVLREVCPKNNFTPGEKDE